MSTAHTPDLGNPRAGDVVGDVGVASFDRQVKATARQAGLLHHTLGLRPESRTPYRNHFVASEGHHDMQDLQVLVGLGLMARSPTPKFCDSLDIVFHVTDAGKAIAIELLPTEPERTRYDDFLRMDGAESFGEFLTGGKVPKFETERDYRNVDGRYRLFMRHRMYRERWSKYDGLHRDVQGDWRATKKDAKASYKAALAQAKATGSAS